MSNSTTSFLNQIFYKHKKFDNASTMEHLNEWMLSTCSHNNDLMMMEGDLSTKETGPINMNINVNTINDVVSVSVPVHIHNNSTPPTLSKQINRQNHIFRPTKEDTLFWCAYTAFHGENGYLVIGNRYKNTEIQEKQDILEYVRANPAIVKRSTGNGKKMSQARIVETQSELMVDKKTSWSAFFIMCLFYKIHAYVLCENTNTYADFCPVIPSDANIVPDVYLFMRNRDGHISVDLTPATNDKVMEIRNTRIHLDYTQERPLKAATNYKISDLEEMANKLGITKDMFVISNEMQSSSKNVVIKPKKMDWYDIITQKCMWLKL